MARKLLNVIILLALGIALLLLYTIVHEGSHALAVLIFKGRVTAVDINFLTGFPRVSYEGAMTSRQNALISLAGPLAPYLLLAAGLLFMNKKRNIFVQKIFTLASIMVLGSIIPNIIIPVLSEAGAGASGEDIVNFMTHLNLNGYLVSAAMFMLLALGIWLAASRLSFRDALVYVPVISRPVTKKLALPLLLLGLFLLAVLVYAACNIFSRNLGSSSRSVPGDYGFFLNIHPIMGLSDN